MQKIIACIDESTWSTSVEDAAIWAGGQLKSPLMFLHIIEKQLQVGITDLSGSIGLGAHAKLMSEIASLDQMRAKVALELGKELLENAQSKAEQAGCKQIETVQRNGVFIDTLLNLENAAQLIILGHSGTKTGKKINVLGSHVESLIRQISTPVLITQHDFTAPKNFMLAYDGREVTELAIQRILDSDLLRGLDCHLVTIRNNQPDQEEKFARAAERLTAGGFTVTATYLKGEISKQLLIYQQENDIDLLVMGAFSGSRLRQFFIGSNTIMMLESSTIPIMVVK